MNFFDATPLTRVGQRPARLRAAGERFRRKAPDEVVPFYFRVAGVELALEHTGADACDQFHSRRIRHSRLLEPRNSS